MAEEKVMNFPIKDLEGTLARELPNTSLKQMDSLDDKGIVKVGVMLRPGDILIGLKRERRDEETSYAEKLLQKIFGDRERLKNCSVRMDDLTYGMVLETYMDETEIGITMMCRVISSEEREEYKKRTHELYEKAVSVIEERVRIRQLMDSLYFPDDELIYKAISDTVSRHVTRDKEQTKLLTRYLEKHYTRSSETWFKKAVLELEWIEIKDAVEQSILN